MPRRAESRIDQARQNRQSQPKKSLHSDSVQGPKKNRGFIIDGSSIGDKNSDVEVFPLPNFPCFEGRLWKKYSFLVMLFLVDCVLLFCVTQLRLCL